MNDAAKNLKKYEINIVLVALPYTSIKERAEIVNAFQQSNVEVKIIPSISDVIENKISIKDLPNISIEDLIGREVIPPKHHLMIKNINDKVVLVTGAGGSIGSELSRQIIKINPSKLIILDFSEFALYSINKELNESIKETKPKIEIVSILGNILDHDLINNVFENFHIDIIFHVAAYKHVPIIEQNIVSGINNNVFGTLNLAKLSINKGIKNFVLVSTDKSVRPTNFMGASKRLAEIICQSFNKNSP